MDENYNNQNNDYEDNQSNINDQNPYKPQPQVNNQDTYNQQQGYYQNSYNQNNYNQNGYNQPQNNYNYNQQQGYQNGYNQPQQYYQNPTDNSKGLAIASLVLGIVGIVFSFILCIGPICSIVGLILGIVSRKKNSVNNGMATAGIVLSIIVLALWAAYLIFLLVAYVLYGSMYFRYF